MGSLQDRRQELTYPAEQVLSKDLVELRNLSSHRRRDLYNKLQENKEEYEWELVPEYQDVLPNQTKKTELAMFEAAKLLMATAIDVADNSDAQSDAFVDQFEPEELAFVREFDDFRRKFKEVDESQLERNIKNKEGQVYEFATDVVDPQADLSMRLLDTQSNDIRGAAISYFQDEFDDFFHLADEAVYLYIKHHGLPNTIEGIVEAAEVADEASSERERIRADLRSEIESLSETIHHSLRDQEQALRAEMSRLETEMQTGGTDTTEVERELHEIKSQISTLSSERRADVTEITDKLDAVSDLETDLNEQIRKLKAAHERTREELQDETEAHARSLLEDELERLEAQKSDLTAEIQRLQSERERLETAGDRLDKEFGTLEERVATAEDRLDTEVEDLEDQVETIGEAVRTQTEESDGKAIRAPVARLYEMDYIARFETSVQESETVALPDSERFTVPDGFWDDRRRHFSGSHRSVVADSLEDEQQADRYPVGRYSVYRVRTNKFVAFSETQLVVEAVVAANLEAFAKNGFDARPAGIDDLIDVVNETLARAESNDTTHLIGIASPTGWTDEVKELVTNDEAARTTYSQQVSVCLVDIQSNELIYDRNDRLVDDNAHLFQREVDSERVADCIETLREEYVDDPMTDLVKHYEIVDRHGYDPHIVRAAFDRLAGDGVGTTGYPGTADGLCLVFD
jgi:predicted  nucleic acid-binding Zn-ribbon protein